MNDDKILLKLYRDYSKDEAVAYLFQKLKEKDLKIGILKSELDELHFENKKISRDRNLLHTKVILIKRFYKIQYKTSPWEFKLKVVKVL